MSLFSLKRGCSARSIKPCRPCARTSGTPSTGFGSRTPLCSRRTRPTRSVINMSPPGKKTILHGWDNPFVTTTTRILCCSPVSKTNGPSPNGGTEMLARCWPRSVADNRRRTTRGRSDMIACLRNRIFAEVAAAYHVRLLCASVPLCFCALDFFWPDCHLAIHDEGAMFPRFVLFSGELPEGVDHLDEEAPYLGPESGRRFEMKDGKGFCSEYQHGLCVWSRVLQDCEMFVLGDAMIMYREHPGPLREPIPGIPELWWIRSSIDDLQKSIMEFPFYLSRNVERVAVVLQGREHTLMSEMYSQDPFPLDPAILAPVLSNESIVVNDGRISCHALTDDGNNFGAVYIETVVGTELDLDLQEKLRAVIEFATPPLAGQLERERGVLKLKRALERPE